jgi:hypothetical protein
MGTVKGQRVASRRKTLNIKVLLLFDYLNRIQIPSTLSFKGCLQGLKTNVSAVHSVF